jgi:RNase P subunit RPR2
MPEVTFIQSVEVEVTDDVSVYCANCGAGLCNQTTVETRRGNHSFTVTPCKACLDASYSDGYTDGLADGKTE